MHWIKGLKLKPLYVTEKNKFTSLAFGILRLSGKGWDKMRIGKTLRRRAVTYPLMY